METVEMFIKDNKITDFRRIELVKKTSAKLREQNLCYSKRIELVSNTLEITSRSCHNLVSKTSFKKKHKIFFLQETGVAMFVLKAAFPPKNLNLKKFFKENLAKLGGSTVYLSYNDPETWSHFKYKAMGVLASDLEAELTGLRFHLGIEKPYFSPVVKVSNLTKHYFKMQVSQLDSIVREGWEEQIRGNKVQNAAFTSTVIRVNDLRGESLFSYYDKMHKACFEDELFSATGNKLSNIRDQRSISEIIDVSQLNASVLCRHGHSSDAQPHFVLKSGWNLTIYIGSLEFWQLIFSGLRLLIFFLTWFP
uniref:hypothetical protein n=1 Tax=Klebsormidium mucosum TaxID=442831 RepID=UPI00286A8FB3|nr:hypothetical protein RMD57_pgp050 [Klebsormidium mucosum]YP_010932942.1 hypothetical protein RMD57_pgp002 [Klebsormidium mucosum]WKT07142.1 hypothetical protein [Klebsormidium mucosum]WKT07143.1 hypothetical protein [Klebsormidium mucosum]